MRRARVPASLKGRGNKCPGRLLVLLDVAQTRAEGRGSQLHRVKSPPQETSAWACPASPFGGKRERANEGSAQGPKKDPEGCRGSLHL